MNIFTTTLAALVVSATSAFAASPTVYSVDNGVFVDSCALGDDFCGGTVIEGSVESVVALVKQEARIQGVTLDNNNNQTSVSLVAAVRTVESLDMATIANLVAHRIQNESGDMTIEGLNAAYAEVQTVLATINDLVATVAGFSESNSNLTDADRAYLSAVTFNELCLAASVGDMPTLVGAIVAFSDALETL